VQGSIAVNMRLFGTSSPVKAYWFNPRTGEASYINTYAGTASVAFPSQSSGPDWVLVLEKNGVYTTPPGSTTSTPANTPPIANPDVLSGISAGTSRRKPGQLVGAT
jgi:hypothetical protein